MIGLLRVFPTVAETATAVATEFFRLASEAQSRQGAFHVALAGGTTPRAAYERIAESWRDIGGNAFAWERVHLFWGDERMVLADDPRSNFGMARAALIDRIPIPPKNVHPIMGAAPDAASAAKQYEDELRAAFGLLPGGLPQFDLVLLGMGPDGHTASLFPGAATLVETSRLALAARHPETGEARVTLTLPVLNQARATIVLVTGGDKSAMLRRAVLGDAPPSGEATPPIQMLHSQHGTVLWIASRDAAPWAPAGSGTRGPSPEMTG